MGEVDKSPKRIGVLSADNGSNSDRPNKFYHCHSGSQTLPFIKNETDIVQWLLEVDAARGKDTPRDMEQEELVAFFKGRSQQGGTLMASVSTTANASIPPRGEEDEPHLTRSVVRLSPHIASSAAYHGKPMREALSSAPQTGRSSLPCGTSASRFSGGGVMMKTATAAGITEGLGGYSPGFVLKQQQQHHQQQSPLVLAASLGRGFVHHLVTGNSSSCSVPDLSLPPSLGTGAPVNFCGTPVKRKVNGETTSTTAVLLETTCGGSDQTTPLRQRILPVADRIRQPPSAPHHDRRRRDMGLTLCCNGVTTTTSRSLQQLRLNNPPKLCPPYAPRLLALVTECPTTNTTTGDATGPAQHLNSLLPGRRGVGVLSKETTATQGR
ncbi:hypothetical protein TCDM_09489 [Trypanosoma cruzi Dm28c]|uniref:Uncharacterized protein n=1 Tax=Trypanosoma cruzi Dm28c TaxID=1416333 RepID=V5B9T1_TRYCR|nr:hypothetical protein TCDM_09489 [Trypanosoma cruzi Dm28c]PBJ72300.1 hypothetical protein BCY84_15886 [Trypanosoma cruzi cruzi]